MSYSYSGCFRTRLSAERHIAKDTSIPDGAKALVKSSLDGLGPDTDERVIVVSMSGHQNHDIKITTYFFTPPRPAYIDCAASAEHIK